MKTWTLVLNLLIISLCVFPVLSFGDNDETNREATEEEQPYVPIEDYVALETIQPELVFTFDGTLSDTRSRSNLEINYGSPMYLTSLESQAIIINTSERVLESEDEEEFSELTLMTIIQLENDELAGEMAIVDIPGLVRLSIIDNKPALKVTQADGSIRQVIGQEGFVEDRWYIVLGTVSNTAMKLYMISGSLGEDYLVGQDSLMGIEEVDTHFFIGGSNVGHVLIGNIDLIKIYPVALPRDIFSAFPEFNLIHSQTDLPEYEQNHETRVKEMSGRPHYYEWYYYVNDMF